MCVFAVAPEAGQSDHDQLRIRLEEHGGGVEAEFLEDARAEGVDEDVGVGEEGEEEGDGAGGFEVEGEGGFVRSEEVVRRGAGGAVDAQDGGAEVGEQEAAEGRCEDGEG